MRFIIFIFSITILFAYNVNVTKNEILKTKYYISKMNKKLDSLAKEIQYKQHLLKRLNYKIYKLNLEIKKLQNTLSNSNKTLSELMDLKKGYEEKAQNIQNQITNFISENYFINTIKIENINDLINKEISKAILKKYSNKINSLIKQNRQILAKINIINKKINTILQKKEQLKTKRKKLFNLLKEQKKELQALKKQKLKYKQKLQALINKQKNLQNKLVKLNIINQNAFKPKISYYKGEKTLSPIRGIIIKKFGSYIDPIYHIRINNPSITIKPYEKNSVVRSILDGRVVYIGPYNDKKVIIIKHKNNLFSIYANLDKVSPLLRQGSFVKRGQIIARVKNTLEFEITYKEKPINPLKVVSIK